MSDEENVETEAAEVPVGPQQFRKEDLKDQVFPSGIYDAEISKCAWGRNKDDAKFAPGALTLRVEYRINAPGEEFDGKAFRPLPMVADNSAGQPFGFLNWLRGLGVDTEADDFTIDPDEFVGMNVSIKLVQKMVGQGASKRKINNLEEIKTL